MTELETHNSWISSYQCAVNKVGRRDVRKADTYSNEMKRDAADLCKTGCVSELPSPVPQPPGAVRYGSTRLVPEWAVGTWVLVGRWLHEGLEQTATLVLSFLSSCNFLQRHPSEDLKQKKNLGDFGGTSYWLTADLTEQRIQSPHTIKNIYFSQIAWKNLKDICSPQLAKISNPWGVGESKFQHYHSIKLRMSRSQQKFTKHTKQQEYIHDSVKRKKR